MLIVFCCAKASWCQREHWHHLPLCDAYR